MYFEKCSQCGFQFDADSPFDRKAHRVRCRAVEKARKKFGLVMTSDEREQAKKEAWPTVEDSSVDLYDRVKAAKTILRAWYSSDLAACNWDLKFDKFQKWARAFLHREGWQVFPSEVWRQLTKTYPPPRLIKKRVG